LEVEKFDDEKDLEVRIWKWNVSERYQASTEAWECNEGVLYHTAVEWKGVKACTKVTPTLFSRALNPPVLSKPFSFTLT